MAADGDALFVPLTDRRLVSMKILEDGEPNWTLKLGGVGGQPLAAAGRIYLGTSEYQFYSIKQDRGDFEWPLGHRLIRSTVVGHPALDEEHIYVATNDNRLLALSRGNGEIDWMPTLTSRPAAQLIVENGQVVVPLISGDLAIFSQKDGKVVSQATAPPAVPGGAPAGAAAAAPPAGPPGAGPTASAAPPAPAAAAPPVPGFGPGATLVTGTPRGSEGIRLAAPLVLAEGPETPELLRVTLGADTVHTVTAFRRAKKPDKPADPAKNSP
jgi:hypothetical protein